MLLKKGWCVLVSKNAKGQVEASVYTNAHNGPRVCVGSLFDFPEIPRVFESYPAKSEGFERELGRYLEEVAKYLRTKAPPGAKVSPNFFGIRTFCQCFLIE